MNRIRKYIYIGFDPFHWMFTKQIPAYFLFRLRETNLSLSKQSSSKILWLHQRKVQLLPKAQYVAFTHVRRLGSNDFAATVFVLLRTHSLMCLDCKCQMQTVWLNRDKRASIRAHTEYYSYEGDDDGKHAPLTRFVFASRQRNSSVSRHYYQPTPLHRSTAFRETNKSMM